MITLTKKTNALPAADLNDDERITALAGALYIADAVYVEALKMPNPAATMDDVCDAWPEIAPEVLQTTKTTPEQADVLKDAVTDRLWAYAAIEYARVEAGDGYGWISDWLVGKLRAGADPHVVRTTALGVPKRLRELAEAEARS